MQEFDNADVNRNGSVSWREFEYNICNNTSLEEMCDHSYFNDCTDKDQDGALDMDEWIAVMTQLENDKIMPETVVITVDDGE